MFGKDEELGKMKEALSATDVDMSLFRNWQKQYDKLNRQWQSVQIQYENAKKETEWVYSAVCQMESMLTGEIAFDAKTFIQLIKEMKRRRNTVDHEFLISREDREFHSTYDTIVRLGTKICEKSEQKLILQSEIENLLALLKEALGREQPSAWKLGFYLMKHSEKELEDLPADEKLVCINRVYEEEFLEPIMRLLITAIDSADKRRAECRKESDRRSRKYLEATEVFDNALDNDSVEERAERIISQMVETR